MSGGGEGEKPVIIIKKGGHGGHGHHGGSWKVAIADLMTAMMALFMVLWLVGQSPKTKSAVGAYFRDPMGLAGGGNTEDNTGPNAGGASFFDGGNAAVAPEIALTPGQIGDEGPSASPQMQQITSARERLAQALMALSGDNWARHVDMTAVEQGLRIEVQDDEEDSLFAPGSTKINPAAKKVLTTIGAELSMLPNRVVIEGHTDARPAGHRKLTNWEISANRANAARRFLVDAGLRRDQVLEVRGYADRRLRLWHDPNNPRNRRISILVLLERGKQRPAPDGPPAEPHPLLEKLQNLDYEAQGPTDELELTPAGDKLPPTPPEGPGKH